MEGAETEEVRLERVVIGNLRAHMVPELKTYIDLAKPNNKPEFDALVEERVMSQPYKRSIYTTRQSG